ncbi:unnamed protein product [Neospora caninum Liverpool]|uniref:Calcium-binding EGF domain-containing protein n=1 Tax=Neospora caninum (strain Liverpool) TaxID=572307 RepID=F0VNV4_NEOCL|nr:uncharacterized protein NCLIV_058230 [Neospora caninum Liverpool]CBZ55400.1 unnamed protein product [Neospora caninum Liverpool]CEL70136.1 TPA: Calcium-binding EGF domain-containing protein [Neospora caninum Liverpool]|eukprot:XP_003885428.1 uncharacterized protein NCLIV_058230 [Neospora caninum Liverpool]
MFRVLAFEEVFIMCCCEWHVSNISSDGTDFPHLSHADPDINECLQNNGGCGRNSDCYNQIGAPLLCKCWEGYDGNNDEPQADCIDVDECSQDGVENLCPENATCVNTIGSYRCTCNSGYVMADDSRCELVDLCSTQTNECDPYFANCIQTGSTATCQCKPFFTGSGKAGDCIPTAGHEHLACALREITCSPYEQCVRNVAAETYSCESKGTMQQLQVFFSQGGSSETPFWIWTVVVLGALMICVGITAVARRMLRKTQETPEENAVTTDSVYAYSYGAMDYYS